MKTNLAQAEEHLLALFEKGFYHELTTDEQHFVIQYMSKEAFNLQHKLRIESKFTFPTVVSKPLSLPRKNNQTLRLIFVSISSAAAAAIITYIIVAQQFDRMKTIQKPVFLMADTVYVPKLDTLIKYEKVKTAQLQEPSFHPSNTEWHEPFISQEELPPIKLFDENHRAMSMHQDRKDWQLNTTDKSDVLNGQR